MRTWAYVAAATALCVAWLGVLQFGGLSDFSVTVVSDMGQLVAAAAASAGCAVAALRSNGPRRAAWVCLSVGTGCWAAGQTVWSFYEVALGREVPFPSVADIGFLAFPVVGGLGLLIWSGGEGHRTLARGRDLMDGVIIATSLLVLSWVTVMAPVVTASGGFGFSLLLSLFYPLGDVVLGTLVLIALFRARSERTTLILLALGIGGFALADSLFVYLTTKGTYSSADLVSSGGWFLGFAIVAAAGLTVTRNAGPKVGTSRLGEGSSWGWLALPYLPLAGAGAALFVDLLQGDSAVLADLLMSVALVVLVLTRQFLAMADNHRLLTALAEAGGQLEHQAMHDALTGLPNRMLFAKRLDQALLTSSSNVSVLFCDLDNFKPVNDELGHAAGDLLLKLVADRLLDCVRAGDTVARLGGDEFGILLVDCPDTREVADRVVASMSSETLILGQPVRTSISVGVAHHDLTVRRTSATPASVGEGVGADTSGRQATADLLIRLADTAMYAAKSAGKGRATVLDAEPVLVPRLAPQPT